MSEDSEQPLEEWLNKRIEYWNNREGRIRGQYDDQVEYSKKGLASFAGPYSWLLSLVQAQLNGLRALKIANDKLNNLRTQFALTLGLDEDASAEDIDRVAREMRDIFIEMRRVRGERASRRGNET